MSKNLINFRFDEYCYRNYKFRAIFYVIFIIHNLNRLLRINRQTDQTSLWCSGASTVLAALNIGELRVRFRLVIIFVFVEILLSGLVVCPYGSTHRAQRAR